MAQQVLAVIPARLGSKRFSGKVLYPWRGKPLLFWVHKTVARSKLIDRLVIATDNDEIERAAIGFGAEVVRTSSKHRTGSDRAAEVFDKLGGDIVLNIQGDNFGLTGSVLDRVIAAMKRDRKIECATLVNRIVDDCELFDPNKVKVVVDGDSNVLWFSRFPLPYLVRAEENNRFEQFPFLGHIGVYFFRGAVLRQFARWKRSPLEKAESLEQLRILANGVGIRAFKTRIRTVSVDSPDDVKKMDGVYR